VLSFRDKVKGAQEQKISTPSLGHPQRVSEWVT
jgi:hypothetical protein